MGQTYAVTYATYNADDEAIGAATCGHAHATLDEATACAGRLQRAGTIRHLDTDEWEVTAMSNQTATGQYAIHCFGWTPEGIDLEGYNAWDYLQTIDGDSRFDSREEAEAALWGEYKGADRDGVEPVLAVVEVEGE